MRAPLQLIAALGRTDSLSDADEQCPSQRRVTGDDTETQHRLVLAAETRAIGRLVEDESRYLIPRSRLEAVQKQKRKEHAGKAKQVESKSKRQVDDVLREDGGDVRERLLFCGGLSCPDVRDAFGDP